MGSYVLLCLGELLYLLSKLMNMEETIIDKLSVTMCIWESKGITSDEAMVLIRKDLIEHGYLKQLALKDNPITTNIMEGVVFTNDPITGFDSPPIGGLHGDW